MHKSELETKQQTKLLQILQIRFNSNKLRHKGIEWSRVVKKLKLAPEKLWSLYEMEKTGGEPDVVKLKPDANKFVFIDCSKESPKGRRNLCYDQEALESRKSNKPKGSAANMANSMGISLLTEEDYRYLQTLGNFDTKTSSWLKTPSSIRKLGGAIFGDCRYNHVFIYHNGADSYYAARGFRGYLRV
jgi:hypothetical protein